MTPDELAMRIERLVAAARDAGLSDETIADALADAAEALREGVS